jgi:hypothetical protein
MSSATEQKGELTVEEEAKAAKSAGSLLDEVIDRTSFNDPVANLLDNRQFSQILRAARLMASSSLVPAHLKGRSADETIANMFLVINQALRWRMDPFAVARESYVVGGNLGYQGKLVAAVINCRAGLADRLSYTYAGVGQALTVTVSGRLEGEEQPRTIELSVKDAATNNDMWTKDPQQKLAYTGATKWARRHAPEVMLGVMTDDDLETIEAAPQPRTQHKLKRVSAESILGPAVEEPANKGPSLPEPYAHLKPQFDAAKTEQEIDDILGAYVADPDDLDSVQPYADEAKARIKKAGGLFDKGSKNPD